MHVHAQHMSFTESPYVTRGQIDGFKESADDAFWGPAEGFFRPILRFDVQCGNQFIQCTDSRPSAPKMPIRVARILEAPIRAHAAHIFCATGVLSRNSRILKIGRRCLRKAPKGLLLPILRVFHSMQTSAIYFDARCAHAAHVFCRIRGEARRL